MIWGWETPKVWYGMVRYGMVWYGIPQANLVTHDLISQPLIFQSSTKHTLAKFQCWRGHRVLDNGCGQTIHIHASI